MNIRQIETIVDTATKIKTLENSSISVENLVEEAEPLGCLNTLSNLMKVAADLKKTAIKLYKLWRKLGGLSDRLYVDTGAMHLTIRSLLNCLALLSGEVIEVPHDSSTNSSVRFKILSNSENSLFDTPTSSETTSHEVIEVPLDSGTDSIDCLGILDCDINLPDTNNSSAIKNAIESANTTVRSRLKQAISQLSWREFESHFLQQVLEALGFENVQITQATNDGGIDAICRYKRLLIQSEAFVSAKHWKDSNKVGPEEVRQLRGIKGNADTGIIITSSEFTQGTVKEAEASQNQRTIALINGDMIVKICFDNGIGVKKVDLPHLFEFDNDYFKEKLFQYT